MHYVIGSGPAGVSCARRLLQAGLSVTLVDGGITIEAERVPPVRELAALDPDGWTPAMVQALTGKVEASAEGVQIKKVFGSDYPYREVDKFIPRHSSNIGHFTPSLAAGGFSNVWGAAVLPYSPKDIQSWPITQEDLAPHYISAMTALGVSAANDELANLFPLYTDAYSTLKPSKQIRELLSDLATHTEILRKAAIYYGAPRLAIRGDSAREAPSSGGCKYCGLCLHGCPYGFIYSARDTLAELTKNSKFTYRPGFVVERVREREAGVEIEGFERTTGAAGTLKGSAVFLGAGVLSTTKILLESLQAFNRPLNLKVSEYFLLPLLRFKRTRGVMNERLHTSAQLFLECFDSTVSEHSVHMQLYSYSDHFKAGLEQMFWFAKPALRLVAPQILERMMVIQGYLHSDDSSHIKVELRRTAKGGELSLEGVPSERAAERIRLLVDKLAGLKSALRAICVKPLLKIGKPGEGRHVGGSFPMSRSPSTFETDVAGRVAGLKRVFVVDASNFPSVPASTITLTAMANAERIAQAYAMEFAMQRAGMVAL